MEPRDKWIRIGAAKILLAGLVFSAACAPHHARYSVELGDVIQPVESVEPHGEVQINDNKVACGNDLFSALWSFGWTSVDLVLTNLSEETIRIIWDECVFVDPYGSCHHIIPSEILYRDVYEHVKPAKVPAGCTVIERLIPRDNVRFLQSGWTELPYLPKQSTGELDEFRAQVLSYLGKEMQVLLAIEVDHQLVEYRFVFEIVDADVLRGTVESVSKVEKRQL